MTQDARQTAAARITELVDLLKAHPGPATPALLQECEGLTRAIAAFHMEGIRFRVYNVDRQMARAGEAIPASARTLLEEARRHLEAAGFHTRSHQAPGQG